MTRLFTTVAVSALVLGMGAPVVRAADMTTTTQTTTQIQAPAQTTQTTETTTVHKTFRRSAQWRADHSANRLNREELAKLQTGDATSYGSSR
jgi:hypothetical protein